MRVARLGVGTRSVLVAVVATILLGACSTSVPLDLLDEHALSVEVTRPSEFPALLRVEGPNGFVTEVASGEDLNDLAPGDYVVIAEAVTVAGVRYRATPERQTVKVPGENGRRGRVSVAYEPEDPADPGSGSPEDGGTGTAPGDGGATGGGEAGGGADDGGGSDAGGTPGAGDGGTTPPAAPGFRTFYVDCSAGDDATTGRSPDAAWRTLSRLGGLSLDPGDHVLLRRGCEWVGPLRIPWQGTAERPIVVGAYGDGPRPGIRDSSSNHVDISGQHLVVEHVRAFTTPGTVWTDPSCQDQPVAWRTGFTLQGSARHVTIRFSEAYGNTAGVHVTRGASFNRILHNDLYDNVIMSRNTPGGDDDSGAWGVVLNGTDNEIGHNRFWGNNAWCSYDYGQEGASIEIYEAQRNLIHHNVATNDGTFVEVGSSSFRASAYNTIAFNTYTTDMPISEFVNVHAGGHFGPTLHTHVFNNTVYLPRTERTQGIVCHAGCGPDVMTLRNNVLVVGWKTIYVDGPLVESNNLYWRPGGGPLMQFFGGSARSSTSVVADPRFVSAATGDFRLRSGSPAIGAGTDVGLTFVDHAGDPIHVGSVVHMGSQVPEGMSMAARP